MLCSLLPILRFPSLDTVVPYNQRLDQDRRWALSEGSLFFEGKGKVQEALQRITKRFKRIGGFRTLFAGGMAMFQHGYRPLYGRRRFCWCTRGP